MKNKRVKYLLAGLGDGHGILEWVQSGGFHEGSLESENSFSQDCHVRDAVVQDLGAENPLLPLLLIVPFQELLPVLLLHQVWLEP